MTKIKHAIILAGGKGTRLRPYTISLPKPLVPVGDEPILSHILSQLSNFGFQRVTLALNHMSEIIRAYCENGNKWHLSIDYTFEIQPLGTMGPLRLIDDLQDNFLVMNGDVLSDLNFSTLLDSHISKGSLLTIASHRRFETIDYGMLEVDAKKRLIGFKEKPQIEALVSMGVYAANRRIIEFIKPNTLFGFDNLVHCLLESKETISTYPFDGFWLDIGRPSDYEKALKSRYANDED